MASGHGCIAALAGVNGAGKSSVIGALLRSRGGAYFNPDEYTRELIAANPGLSESDANSAAWQKGYDGLVQAITKCEEYTFETTLGGRKVLAALQQAATNGMDVVVWYVGLSSVELHLQRVTARVALGGHSIPEAKIRARYNSSRENIIALLPQLTELQVFDNSDDSPPSQGREPQPKLLLHLQSGKILGPTDLAPTPTWAKPIVTAALKLKPR